ncbi:MAG: hypothetical protein ACKO24_08260 [Leptolyngbyaceae cyanobacterium]
MTQKNEIPALLLSLLITASLISTAVKLSGFSPYFFRTVSSDYSVLTLWRSQCPCATGESGARAAIG